jgi:hypothetical protein
MKIDWHRVDMHTRDECFLGVVKGEPSLHLIVVRRNEGACSYGFLTPGGDHVLTVEDGTPLELKRAAARETILHLARKNFDSMCDFSRGWRLHEGTVNVSTFCGEGGRGFLVQVSPRGAEFEFVAVYQPVLKIAFERSFSNLEEAIRGMEDLDRAAALMQQWGRRYES